MPAHALSIPRASTSTQDRSFLHSPVRIWNNLPETAFGEIMDNRVQAFKSRVHEYLLAFSWSFFLFELRWTVDRPLGVPFIVSQWDMCLCSAVVTS